MFHTALRILNEAVSLNVVREALTTSIPDSPSMKPQTLVLRLASSLGEIARGAGVGAGASAAAWNKAPKVCSAGVHRRTFGSASHLNRVAPTLLQTYPRPTKPMATGFILISNSLSRLERLDAIGSCISNCLLDGPVMQDQRSIESYYNRPGEMLRYMGKCTCELESV